MPEPAHAPRGRSASRFLVGARRLGGLWLLASSLAIATAQGVKADVEAGFDAYRLAILASDGAAALATVDTQSVTFYSDLVRHALDTDSADVARLPVLEQMLVLAMRVRVPVDTLRRMGGAAAFQYGVDRGWIGVETVQSMRLGTITVREDRATASALLRGEPVPGLRFAFAREEGTWRFDVWDLQASLSAPFLDALKKTGMATSDFLLLMLSSVSEKPVTASVWHPIGR